ncbi:hypothetical protein F5884DRAFT_147134 [Xylogone sp. PMI_703]|nr:hypothetical protein F5884DRAFT_147134 [Xylogone sp. PMI_703]
MKLRPKRGPDSSQVSFQVLWFLSPFFPHAMFSSTEFQFGHRSAKTSSTKKKVIQYSLHPTEETSINFTTTIDDECYKVRFVFKPFRRKCNLTYHEYEIHCSTPQRESEAGIRYKIALLETEVQISLEDTNLATIKNYGIEDGKRMSKRLKLDHVKALEKVQASYAEAKKASKIKSPWMPKVELESNHQQIQQWDPYVLQKQHLTVAVLKSDKLDNILNNVQQTVKRVPTAKDWETQTQTSQLRPADICNILRVTFGCSAASKSQYQQSTLPIDTPYILRLSAAFCRHADDLDDDKIVNQRAALIARLIGFALMRVHEVASSTPPSEVNVWMDKCFTGTRDRHKQSRNFVRAWCWMIGKLQGWRGRDLALYFFLGMLKYIALPSFRALSITEYSWKERDIN